MKRTVRLMALTSLVAAAVAMPVAKADETAPLPGSTAPTDSSTAPVPGDASSLGSQSAAAAGTSSAANSAAAEAGGPEVMTGPLQKERLELLDHIRQAGEHGIGTGNYMMAYKAIEEQVKSGAGEGQIRPRVESLNNALIEQLKRAQILKTQRPLPPTNSQQPDASGAATAVAGGGGGAAPGGGGLVVGGKQISPDMINKIKEKLGGAGGGLGGLDLPEGLKEKLLQSDRAKELLKHFSQ